MKARLNCRILVEWLQSCLCTC